MQNLRHLGISYGQRISIRIDGTTTVAKNPAILSRISCPINFNPVSVGRVLGRGIDDDVSLQRTAFDKTCGLIVISSRQVQKHAHKPILALVVRVQSGSNFAVAVSAERPADLYEQLGVQLVLLRINNAAGEKMKGRVELRHVTADLLVHVQGTIRAGRFNETNEHWTVILEVVYWMASILDDYECPLRRSFERFRQVNVRNDFCFRNTLVR